MQAALINRFDGTFDLERVEVDAPVGREVLVEVRAAGLCHSDHIVASVDRGRPAPVLAGHELAGVVVAVGPDVETLAVGDHVAGGELRFCGACDECLSGRTYRCMNPGRVFRAPGQSPRVTRDGEPVTTLGVGAFAPRSLAHEHQFVRVPRGLPFAQAALLGCAVATGVGAAVNVARVAPGDTVVVIGLGGVGLNVLAGARLAGAATIIGVDVHPAKLELARRFGATHAIDGSDADVTERIRSITGCGVDAAFEAAGRTSTIRAAIEATRVGGGVYCIGLPVGQPALEIDVMRDLIATQRRIEGVYMGATNLRRDVPRYAALALAGRLDLGGLVGREIRLEQINDAYAVQESGAVARTVVTDFD